MRLSTSSTTEMFCDTAKARFTRVSHFFSFEMCGEYSNSSGIFIPRKSILLWAGKRHSVGGDVCYRTKPRLTKVLHFLSFEGTRIVWRPLSLPFRLFDKEIYNNDCVLTSQKPSRRRRRLLTQHFGFCERDDRAAVLYVYAPSAPSASMRRGVVTARERRGRRLHQK